MKLPIQAAPVQRTNTTGTISLKGGIEAAGNGLSRSQPPQGFNEQELMLNMMRQTNQRVNQQLEPLRQRDLGVRQIVTGVISNFVPGPALGTANIMRGLYNLGSGTMQSMMQNQFRQ
jgi:metal-dependent amidase/aminoacylase/carboxypeptidase family protein